MMNFSPKIESDMDIQQPATPVENDPPVGPNQELQQSAKLVEKQPNLSGFNQSHLQSADKGTSNVSSTAYVIHRRKSTLHCCNAEIGNMPLSNSPQTSSETGGNSLDQCWKSQENLPSCPPRTRERPRRTSELGSRTASPP